MMLILLTARLILKPLSIEELRLCGQGWDRMEAALALDRTGGRLDEATQKAINAKLNKMAHDNSRTPWYTYWLLIDKETNQAVGLFGFKGPPSANKEVEIGYGTQPAFRGQGYMTEAARRIIQWAFQQDPAVRVTAETEKTNVPSHRVLRKLGFTITRETPDAYWWLYVPRNHRQDTAQP